VQPADGEAWSRLHALPLHDPTSAKYPLNEPTSAACAGQSAVQPAAQRTGIETVRSRAHARQRAKRTVRNRKMNGDERKRGWAVRVEKSDGPLQSPGARRVFVAAALAKCAAPLGLQSRCNRKLGACLSRKIRYRIFWSRKRGQRPLGRRSQSRRAGAQSSSTQLSRAHFFITRLIIYSTCGLFVERRRPTTSCNLSGRSFPATTF